MKDLSLVSRSALVGLLEKARRYQLVLACAVIVLCFAIGNDIYAAKRVAQRHRDLLNGRQRTVDYSDAVRRKAITKAYGSDLSKKYLIDPKAAKQPTLMAVLGREADTCNQITSFINSLPFSESGTTVGATDNYDLDGDPTSCPAPTCVGSSGGFPDALYTYDGSGTGPDVAYSIAFIQPTTLKIVLHPTDDGTEANPIGDDLGIIFYGAGCSSNASDAIFIADNVGDGNPPLDDFDNTETLTITSLPPGAYNIVVDGYSYANQAVPSQGPYTITVDCLPIPAPCSIPGYRRR